MALASLESHHSEVLSEPPPLLESVAGRKYHCPLCLSSPSLQYPVMSKSWRLLRSLVWLVRSGTAERMYPICCIFNCQGAWGNYKFIPLLISTGRACFWSMFSKKFLIFFIQWLKQGFLNLFPYLYAQGKPVFKVWFQKKILNFFIQWLKQDFLNLFPYLYAQGKLVFKVWFQKKFSFF